MTYRILRTLPELRAFVPEWQMLFHADPRSTPFQAPEWLVPWAENFVQPDQFFCITLYQDGSCIGFLPFYLLRAASDDELQMQLLGVGTSDYLDGLFDVSCRVEDVLHALSVGREATSWTSLHASQLRPQSLLRSALDALASEHGRSLRSGDNPARYTSEPCSIRPAVPISLLPAKIRRNAMYYTNAAARRGSLTLSIAGPEGASAVFESFITLHTERWRSTGEPGVLADERVLAWHRCAVPLLANAGLLRLCTLYLDERPMGILYALADLRAHLHRTEYIYLTAYETSLRELRPGTLLLAQAIEAAAKEGIQHIDMLRGQEAYKHLWHVETSPTFGFVLPRSALQVAHVAPTQALHV